MKQITIDYDLYKKELKDEQSFGKWKGLGFVVDFLESKEDFHLWYSSQYEFADGEPVGLLWEKLLMCLGRESELEPKKST